MNEAIRQCRIVPVVALDRAEDAIPLAEALEAGGCPLAEITFRTAAAADAIERLAKRENFIVGAGTIHRVEQAQVAVDAGAAFLVTPGLNPKVVAWCRERKVPIYPGTATPTELELAMEFELSVVKFFPAELLGGVAMLRALSGPYGAMRFLPTGGIHAGNLRDYLDLPCVIACGGSWMVQRDWIAAGEFDRIEQATAAAIEQR